MVHIKKLKKKIKKQGLRLPVEHYIKKKYFNKPLLRACSVRGILLCAMAIKEETNKQQQPFPNYSLPFLVCKSIVIRVDPIHNIRDLQAWHTNGRQGPFAPDISPHGVGCRESY